MKLINIVMSSSSFFMCEGVQVHLDLMCGIPKSDLRSSKKLFQAVMISVAACLEVSKSVCICQRKFSAGSLTGSILWVAWEPSLIGNQAL